MKIPQFRHMVQVLQTPGLRQDLTYTCVPCSVWQDRERAEEQEWDLLVPCFVKRARTGVRLKETHWIQTAASLQCRLSLYFYCFPGRKEADRNNVETCPNCAAFTAGMYNTGDIL